MTVGTSRKTYAAGEPVTLVLTNGSNKTVYSLARSQQPGRAVRNFEIKNPRGIWDAFFLKNRKGADSDFEAAGAIKPGQSISFDWQPEVLVNGEVTAPGPGLYRITVIYHTRQGKRLIFGTCKSNDFNIE
ncbi:MAG: hypothetical protein ACM3OC_05530 [Deltaproteobacteria bacterium]